MVAAIILIGFIVVAVQLNQLRTLLVEVIKELRALKIRDERVSESSLPDVEDEAQISIDKDAGR